MLLPPDRWIDLAEVVWIRLTCKRCNGAAGVNFQPGVRMGDLPCPGCAQPLLPEGSSEREVFEGLHSALLNCRGDDEYGQRKPKVDLFVELGVMLKGGAATRSSAPSSSEYYS